MQKTSFFELRNMCPFGNDDFGDSSAVCAQIDGKTHFVSFFSLRINIHWHVFEILEKNTLPGNALL